MSKWKLRHTTQCAKCPWRKDVDPRAIPGEYSEEKHHALRNTIADPNNPMSSLLAKTQRIMACHEDHGAHCIGWLVNQLGEGNNITLRLRMRTCENGSKVRTIGKQHATFEETLPKPLPPAVTAKSLLSKL